MEKAWINEQIKGLSLDEVMQLQEIPNIDLYMDQLITLFENRFNHTKRYEADKLLTKTMINNYTKDKVLMPAVKKKYTREHIILMLILYQLKNTISITDIKDLFSIVKEDGEVEVDKLVSIYESYINLKEKEIEEFEISVEKKLERINDISNGNEDIETFLMVTSLIEQANYNKKLAEKIIDIKIKNKD